MSRLIIDAAEEVGLQVPLGRDRFARLAYPADMTTSEAQRLAGIIATLGIAPERLDSTPKETT